MVGRPQQLPLRLSRRALDPDGETVHPPQSGERLYAVRHSGLSSPAHARAGKPRGPPPSLLACAWSKEPVCRDWSSWNDGLSDLCLTRRRQAVAAWYRTPRPKLWEESTRCRCSSMLTSLHKVGWNGCLSESLACLQPMQPLHQDKP